MKEIDKFSAAAGGGRRTEWPPGSLYKRGSVRCVQTGCQDFCTHCVQNGRQKVCTKIQGQGPYLFDTTPSTIRSPSRVRRVDRCCSLSDSFSEGYPGKAFERIQK